MSMFKRYTFTRHDQPGCEVFAHKVEFTAAHVVFRDPDGEVVVAVLTDSVNDLMPERTAEGAIVQYTSEEALVEASRPRSDAGVGGVDWR